MDTEYNEPTAYINPFLIRELLLEISVSPEIGRRLGVPVVQLEQWLRELAGHVNDWPRLANTTENPEQTKWKLPFQNGKILSAGEIGFLLEGFDATQAV